MSKPIYSAVIGDEIHIYVFGRLIMKRRIGSPGSRVFHMPLAATQWS